MKTGAEADDPAEFTEADREHLRQLHDFMIARGYRLNRFGFWVIPGEEELLEAAMRRDFEEDGE
jgi:hypothetical protein